MLLDNQQLWSNRRIEGGEQDGGRPTDGGWLCWEGKMNQVGKIKAEDEIKEWVKRIC